jgi:putative endonuclease
MTGQQPTTGSRGAAAEVLAEQYLQQQGLRSCARNYRCKLGEIDLIMRDGECLVFIEVRLRNNRYFASAAESITAAKQHRILRTAQFYLQQHQLTDKVPCRFDVIALGGNGQTVEWLRDAFGNSF